MKKIPDLHPEVPSKPLYEAKLSDAFGYKLPKFPVPVELPAKFSILFDHRWWLYCKMMDRKFLDIRPHLTEFYRGYQGPVTNRKEFDNMFCIPTNSPFYEGLSETQRATFTNNLVNLYDLVYSLLHTGTTDASAFNHLINHVISNRTVLKHHQTL